jgi:integration host factor subunit alpha
MHKIKGILMTLTKDQIIKKIHPIFQGRHTKNKSIETVEILLEIIKKTLESGEDVLISGFGKFSVKEKKEREGRNPVTGQTMILDKRRVVTFKSSGRLRDRINKK